MLRAFRVDFTPKSDRLLFASAIGVDVEYALGKLTDVDRHTLLQQWRLLARVYETQQFHVRRSGLALLVAYVLHLIQVRHAAIPT